MEQLNEKLHLPPIKNKVENKAPVYRVASAMELNGEM